MPKEETPEDYQERRKEIMFRLMQMPYSEFKTRQAAFNRAISKAKEKHEERLKNDPATGQ